MFAAADSDAVLVCVLPNVECSDGPASCAVDVGTRSFGARSISHFAGGDHHYDAHHAADDAAGGHGSGAAEDDEHHDARHAGHHELEFAGRTGAVLVGGTADWDRTAVGDEPYVAGPRDARDDGEAGAEERKIVVSHQFSVVSYIGQLRTDN